MYLKNYYGVASLGRRRNTLNKSSLITKMRASRHGVPRWLNFEPCKAALHWPIHFLDRMGP